jgi:hypothetical protein
MDYLALTVPVLTGLVWKGPIRKRRGAKMLENILSTVQSVFMGSDATSQVIMLVVALAAGLALTRVTNIVNVTVGALVVYGLVRLGLMATQGTQPGELPSVAWNSLSAMTVNNLVVYFLAFAIVILIVYMVRGVMANRH